ncbi:MAG: PKD domain-containing protein [Bacteroidia bacterium]
MTKRLYIILFFAFFAPKLFAQTCTIITSSNIVCINNALNFSATYTAGLTPSSYDWNFGNGVTNTQASPTYNYPITGTFTPTLKITFTNNSQCIISGTPIQVVALPIADFRIITPTTQCFIGNSVCVTDLSRPGASASPLTIRTFLWGDGGFDNTAITNKTLCHTYTNIAGSTNSLVIEVTDANNCLTRVELNNAIVIRPKPSPISFYTQYVPQCNSTPVTFLNTSVLALAKVKKFTWDFGDGTFDSSSTNWNNFVHTYTKGGFFSPRLTITDLNDCVQTFLLYNGAQNVKLDDKITIVSNSKCFSQQDYSFSIPGSAGSKIYWAIYDSKNKLFDTLIYDAYSQQPSRRFSCGQYKVKVYAVLGSCKVQIDTLIDVYGPNTILTNDTVKAINSAQCSSEDTVYFRTPPPEISCFYKNVTEWLWDFDDGFAPPCTTDTKNGIFVGVNCRYSKDSSRVNHKYDTTSSKCYSVKLTISDPIRNCSDIDSTLIVIGRPNAKPNLPTRKGLYYYTIPPGIGNPPLNCYTSNFVFQFEETLPDCGREKMWINVDSTANKNNWDSVNPKENFYPHRYSNTADSNGWVTTGLIIKNGICYDTAWYHNMFQLIKIKPQFTTKIEGICAPYKVTVTLLDSIQDSLVTAKINFDGVDSTQNFSITDSVIHQKSYVFKSMGIKKLKVTLYNRKGCSQSYDTVLNLGFYAGVNFKKPIVCLNDSVTFLDSIDYYSRFTGYWRLNNRANFEKVSWNFGDTNAYIKTGSLPKYKYKHFGEYTIKIAVQDSLGCRDTLTIASKLKVVDVKAGIGPISANLICAPKIIPFTDISKILDSSAITGVSKNDSIKVWRWDFGDLKVESLLKNPLHDFTSNGIFQVKLIVLTQAGCTDSITLPLNIKGPKPKYTFASGDTLGCSPVKLKINNSTGVQLQSWQWTVNGPTNFILSTDKDTATNFTLIKSGRYRILLLGTDSLVNEVTGQTIYCTSVFPDTLNPSSRPVFVTVYDKPLVQLFGPDTVCPNELFTIKAKADTMYNQFLWQTSTGFSSGIKPRTDTLFNYSFKDSGNYFIKLIPTPKVNIKCIDTAIHNIYVQNIKADFDIIAVSSPIYSFANKSTNASKYYWNFGQPSSGANNISNIQNPTHDYKSLNDSFKVCLVVKNISDCFDTTCKIIIPVSRLIAVPNVFTPNGDGINDAFDIDILGEMFYEIKIFNRWGNKVFESTADGKGNDGNNWNGKTDNDGSVNSAGVYYYTFKYKFDLNENVKTLHGTITLIND